MVAFYAVPCAELADRLLDELRNAGMQARRTFDLQSARAGLAGAVGAVCPRHGTRSCTCQYMVIQVSRGGSPLTILLHGRDGFTEATLPIPPQSPSGVEAEIHIILGGLNRGRRRDGKRAALWPRPTRGEARAS